MTSPLKITPEELANEAIKMQAKLARGAIQEITALCAVLIEVDCMAAGHRLLMEREGAGK